MSIEVKLIRDVSEEYIDQIIELDQVIFEKPFKKEKYLKEIPKKYNFLLFMAFDGNKPVAYKAGYEMSGRLYYSWLGGVHPDYRGQGLAKKLMEQQHSELAKLGYQQIRTHTKNQFKSMLILNLKAGFDIVGVYKSSKDADQMIMLERNLSL